jgi:replicative DNA helicase
VRRGDTLRRQSVAQGEPWTLETLDSRGVDARCQSDHVVGVPGDDLGPFAIGSNAPDDVVARPDEVARCVRGLKDLSGELGMPVLALVQLNRNRASRADKRPQLADLRESGDLEDTADSVLRLYREEMDHPGTDNHGLAELSVLKKRQLGEEVGTLRRLVWVSESYRDFADQV